MSQNEFEPRWGVVFVCIAGLIAFFMMHAVMDVNFAVEKHQEYRP